MHDSTESEVMLLRYAFESHQQALEMLRLTDEKMYTEEAFESPQCRAIYSTLTSMRDNGLRITIPAFMEHIDRNSRRPNHDFFSKHFTVCDAPYGRMEYYVDIVKDLWIKRRLLRMGRHAELMVKDGNDGEEIAANIHSELCQMLSSPTILTSERAAEQVLEHWENAKNGIRIGIPTPFERFNARTGGIQRKLLTVLCGRAGIGKSFILSQWYHTLGSGQFTNGEPIPAAAFVFEDGIERTMARVASIAGDFSAYERDVGNSTDCHIEQARRALDTVKNYPVFYEERHMNVKQIRAHLNRMKVDYNIQVAFIDGWKDIQDDHDRWDTNRVERYMSQHLCETAQMLDVALVAVHHLTKMDDNVIITDRNIRGSGLITADARMAIELQNNTNKDGVSFGFKFDLIKTNFTRKGCVNLRRASNRGWFIQSDESTDAQEEAQPEEQEDADDIGQDVFPF